MRKYITILFFFTITTLAFSQEIRHIDQSIAEDSTRFNKSQLYTINDSTMYVYSKPTPFKWISDGFKDIVIVPKQYWKKESIVPFLGVAASTALLIAYDGKIYDGVRNFSDYIGLSPKNNTINLTGSKTFAFNIPTDFSSGLYYIGDGITEIGIAAGFSAYGLITKDVRARRTASELAEGMVAVGVTVQVLKHLTMRSTPQQNKPDYPNGKWEWFDFGSPIKSLKEYSRSVPEYDAYPSGHLITAMMTTTVIANNYPEKLWIKPVGYSLMALCGFQMINNGVHWASDYPLAIYLGYAFGNVIVNKGRQKVRMTDRRKAILGFEPKPEAKKPHWELKPAILGYDAAGLTLRLQL